MVEVNLIIYVLAKYNSFVSTVHVRRATAYRHDFTDALVWSPEQLARSHVVAATVVDAAPTGRFGGRADRHRRVG